MLFPIVLFAVGLLCLIKGGDWFVDGATGIAHRFRMPELLVGATVVSIGTTLPEVMVSATSAVSGHSQIAYGNAIGSCICNVALIAAVTAAVAPPVVEAHTFRTPVRWFFGAAVLYSAVAYATGYFSRPVGLVLLALFVVYMVLTVREAFRDRTEEPAAEEENGTEAPLRRYLMLLVIGAGFIAVGADLLVDNGTLIAKALGVPESVIALTFVALGTSLPELVTAITALVKKHSDLSLGNIIGANLFNLLLVSGMAVSLNPFSIPVEKTIAGLNASLVLDIPLMFLVMAILVLPALRKGRLYRWQGISLLAIYFSYCAFQFFA